ncbi:MAG: TatD family hydrolase [Rikenellaceae bacterium]
MHKFIDLHSHSCSDELTIISYRLGIDKVYENDCKFTIGIHPWDVNNDIDLSEINKYINSPNLVGIGEVGLDFHKAKTDKERDLQKQVFISHIEIANTHELPLIIHSVKANNEVYTILKTYNKSSKVIFHSFIGNCHEAHQLTNAGYYLSLSPLAFKSEKTIAAFKSTSLNHIFCETDDTKHNITDVYNVLSKVKGESLELIKQELLTSYKKVFKNG